MRFPRLYAQDVTPEAIQEQLPRYTAELAGKLEKLIRYGPRSQRPAGTGSLCFYYALDEGKLYLDVPGQGWLVVGAGG